MKIRESGMPERDMWEKFFDPMRILATLGLNKKINDVAEFGCGYGTFIIPAAKIIKGNGAAHIPQGIQLGENQFLILKEGAFGDFHVKPIGGKLAAFERVVDFRQKGSGIKLGLLKIDGDNDVRRPLCRRTTGVFNAPVAKA